MYDQYWQYSKVLLLTMVSQMNTCFCINTLCCLTIELDYLCAESSLASTNVLTVSSHDPSVCVIDCRNKLHPNSASYGYRLCSHFSRILFDQIVKKTGSLKF